MPDTGLEVISLGLARLLASRAGLDLLHGQAGFEAEADTQLAHAAGAIVIGSASTPAGADLVRAAGATHVLDHGSAGYLDELTRITDGQGPSVIVEMAAHLNLEKDLTVLATAGRVVIVGSLDFTPRLAMVKEATILGLALWNATPAETTDALTGVAARLREGALVPVVGDTLPLREAAAAHRCVLEQGTRGKLVLIPE
ncbi:zinc-binding dehydrogenase [Streptomyces variegatus]|jgi:NADPH2:quinone reductase|uniref:zinc-binding dehydrogenase n=1 Tax=Streptomyces variegatus TaxID=284040 RepID=UPI003C2CC553